MINHCYCQLQNKDQFVKWVIQQLGPVLLGVKPAEILSFPTNIYETNNHVESIKHLFESSHKISCKEFYTPNGCMKIFFYNIKSLDNTLMELRNLKFLKGLGYSHDYQMDLYLDLIIEKLQKGEMPHEIGIFLGYPLKDVLGFIGHPSLKLTKVNGWRIYGNPQVSDLKCQQILAAKQQIKRQLETLEIENVVAAVS
ncbi:hypothetical protein Amet_1114 [Alkaliphilus metalliredigens QYMF]|uniref:DUF3793 domain-containing protein n=1 Tax=Alkaliphilus metalliredigens (strain QYMF) TaxID=293826 RepID=A6TMA7_ALKMQ|nr:DUF3793 family protein [Alkaliphilus metalliredigens]ABR47325.1 hypothetical protein Amet_1114 [Alkaliphilus metalliredigens QYMF]